MEEVRPGPGGPPDECGTVGTNGVAQAFLVKARYHEIVDRGRGAGAYWQCGGSMLAQLLKGPVAPLVVSDQVSGRRVHDLFIGWCASVNPAGECRDLLHAQAVFAVWRHVAPL